MKKYIKKSNKIQGAQNRREVLLLYKQPFGGGGNSKKRGLKADHFWDGNFKLEVL